MILPATKRTRRQDLACDLAGCLSTEARVRLYFVRLCAQTQHPAKIANGITIANSITVVP